MFECKTGLCSNLGCRKTMFMIDSKNIHVIARGLCLAAS